MYLDYVRQTDKSFEDTLEVLKKELADRKFGVLASISLSDKFKDKGLEYNGKLTILEICNPFEASQALSLNPMSVYFLPCKMIVEELNGLTLIKMARPSVLIQILEDQALVSFAQRIEDLLIQAAEAV
jgi:uncharacterized protein (DUF302 family)